MRVDIETLYDMYFMRVYSYVMTLAKNPAMAEDITQTAFFRAMQSTPEHRDGAGEFTWLCVIARNLYIDEYRKHRNIRPLAEFDDLPGGDSIEQRLEDSDSSYRIHCILHTLDEPYKEVFLLRVFGELPFKTIGEIFKKTENWARVTYHRARLKIRERMDGE